MPGGHVGNKHLTGRQAAALLPRCARAPGLSGVDRRGRAADWPSRHREPSPARPSGRRGLGLPVSGVLAGGAPRKVLIPRWRWTDFRYILPHGGGC